MTDYTRVQKSHYYAILFILNYVFAISWFLDFNQIAEGARRQTLEAQSIY